MRKKDGRRNGLGKGAYFWGFLVTKKRKEGERGGIDSKEGLALVGWALAADLLWSDHRGAYQNIITCFEKDLFLQLSRIPSW